MTRWGAYVKQRLDDLAYGKGRDLWEGEWPPPATARAAWKIACDTFEADTPTPSVVPTEDGWIAFVWRKCGYDIELEVAADGYAEVWIHKRDEEGNGKSAPLGEARGRLRSLLSDLAA